MHRKRFHVGVGIVGEQLACDEMRVFENLPDIVDRADGHFGLFKKRDILFLRALRDEGADHGVEFFGVFHALGIGGVARVGDEFGMADGMEQALGHFLRR